MKIENEGRVLGIQFEDVISSLRKIGAQYYIFGISKKIMYMIFIHQ